MGRKAAQEEEKRIGNIAERGQANVGQFQSVRRNLVSQTTQVRAGYETKVDDTALRLEGLLSSATKQATDTSSDLLYALGTSQGDLGVAESKLQEDRGTLLKLPHAVTQEADRIVLKAQEGGVRSDTLRSELLAQIEA